MNSLEVCIGKGTVHDNTSTVTSSIHPPGRYQMDFQMEQYVYKRKNDGLYIINLRKKQFKVNLKNIPKKVYGLFQFRSFFFIFLLAEWQTDRTRYYGEDIKNSNNINKIKKRFKRQVFIVFIWVFIIKRGR